MKFSIIIPAKNEEANIGHCLDSILGVDFDRSQYEVIVIDNGSSDRTPSIAREKGAMVHEKPELTIAAMRNFGARVARGEVLAFLDADCTVPASWLSEASRYLSHSDVVCFGSPPTIPRDATWVQKSWFRVRCKSRQVEDVQWLESMNMFVRREAFDAVGGFNEDLVTCEDYDLSLRLAKRGRIVSDGRIVAVHHGEAATVKQFFRKELWRGTSNLTGIRSHGFSWKELPSVLFPLVYLLCLSAVFLWLPAGIFVGRGVIDLALLLLLAGWQVPIFAMAIWKQRGEFSLSGAFQLHLLLNVYFLARGSSLLQRDPG